MNRRAERAGGRGRAFGLDVEVDFPFDGLPPPCPHDDGSGRRVRLTLGTRQEVTAPFATGAERLFAARRPGGRPVAFIDAHPRAGYLLAADGCGRFLVSPDGARVVCAPVRVAAWRWQLYVVAQVLPFVAVLHGLEVFHSSVVAVGSDAIAFVGRSEGGKSTLAMAMVARSDGARVMADDVMAVEAVAVDGEPTVMAHPGFGMMNVRHEAADRAGEAAIERLGRRVGTGADAVRVAVDVAGPPRRLAAMYVIERVPAGPLGIETLAPVDPRVLLASSYNFVIRTRDRLTRQLDMCGLLSRSVTVARLTIPPTAGPGEVADAVAAHARTVVAAA